MSSTTFLTWSDFTANTSVTLPRYYFVRGDGFLNQAMGVNTSSGVTHVYVAATDETIVVSGVGADTWFVGAIEVLTFNA